MVAIQEVPEGERLARIEATLDALVRQNNDFKGDLREVREEMREARKENRSYFFWILGVLIGIWTPSLVGLIVTIILKG